MSIVSKRSPISATAELLLPNINRTQAAVRSKKCRFLSLVTLTFDLWPWHSSLSERGTKHVFRVNLAHIRSAVPEIFHTQTKKSQTAPKQNHRQFTACGKKYLRHHLCSIAVWNFEWTYSTLIIPLIVFNDCNDCLVVVLCYVKLFTTWHQRKVIKHKVIIILMSNNFHN